MTTYKEIKGTQIEVVSSDPSNPVEGQVWYNSTDQAVKGQVLTAADAWATGGTINSRRYALAGAAANNTDAIVFGGYPNGAVGNTENYNGSNWTEVNDMNNARGYLGGAGTHTAGLAIGGLNPPSTGEGETELWNGTSWAEQNDLATGRSELSGSGSSTSGLAFGGTPGGVALTEEWTGAGAPIGAWSTGGSMNTARGSVAGTPAGTQSAAMASTGQTAGGTKNASVEQYNGTNWTEITDVNTARSNLGGAGTSTSNLIFAGGPGSGTTGATESWNGSAWTEVADLGTPTQQIAGCGASNTSALAFGGYDGPTGFLNKTDTWNGSSWTEVNSLNTAKASPGGRLYSKGG